MNSKNLHIIIAGLIIFLLGVFVIVSNKQTNVNNSNSSAVNSKSGNQTSQNNSPVTIKMPDGTFVPDKITIKKGQVVIFVNESKDDRWPASNIHPTHQIYSEFDPKRPIKPGDSWSFKFDKVGIWRFHDHLSLELGGVVTVE